MKILSTIGFVLLIFACMAGSVAAVNCSPPSNGDWEISSDCTLASTHQAKGDVHVTDNSVLTIDDGVTLKIDMADNNLTVDSGSGVKIENTGKIIDEEAGCGASPMYNDGKVTASALDIQTCKSLLPLLPTMLILGFLGITRENNS